MFLVVQNLAVFIDFQLTIYIGIPVSNNCATFICASFDNFTLRCLMVIRIFKDFRETRTLSIDFCFLTLTFFGRRLRTGRKIQTLIEDYFQRKFH